MTDPREALNRDGFVVIDDALSTDLVDRLGRALDDGIRATAQLLEKRGLGQGRAADEGGADGDDGALGGAAHHVVLRGGPFFELLEARPAFSTIADFLGSEKFVLNAFGGVSNPRDADAYAHGKSIHRDTRSHHPSFRQLLWMFVPLDDFTPDNGATWVWRGSQVRPEVPSAAEFYANAEQICIPRGSLVLLDGRVWHAAGQNRTDFVRRLLTIAFSRPFVKPQLDYCRALGSSRVEAMGETLRQLFGYYARIPASLDEWYQPPERRFYRSSQG